MKRVFLVLLALLVAVLSGCGSKVKNADADAQQYSDYVSEGQWVSGGGHVQNANAKEVKVTSEAEDTLRVEVSFVLDSRISGSGGETSVPEGIVPAYSVCMLPSPARLVIEFDALTYWDFARNFDPSGAAHVLGWFEQMFADSDTMRLYLQLDTSCVFKVQEEGGKLVVLLKPAAQPEAQSTPEPDVMDVTKAGTKFYVTANAYRDYCSGVLSREIDMHPTLCAESDNIILISRGFDTPTQAESFKDSTLKFNPSAVEAEWQVIELADNALPPYSQELEYAAAYSVKAARVNGEEITPELLIPDGLLLCAQPDSGGLLYSKRIIGGDVRDEYEYEELYLRERGGASKRLLRYEFETIESASYSPDGRKLAVLERSSSGASHLYIFDVDTKELLVDLASVGFGDTISCFTWDAMGTIIFAVSGSEEMQINQYDFNIPDESKRFSVVDKKGADEGSICYLDGEVYFYQTEMTGSTIYKIKPEGGLRKPFFTGGGAFALSPDGERMAISVSSGDLLDANGKSSLVILDMQTGEQRLVEEDFAVYDLLWSGDVLYYIENRLSGGANESERGGEENGAQQETARDAHPYTLWRYDGQNKTPVADLSTTSIQAVGGNRVAVCYSDPQTMGKVVRATYVLN